VNPKEVLSRIEIPAANRFISIRESEGEFIHSWVNERGLARTLEIGLAYGASAACILAAHQGRHTCIDPRQDTHFRNLGVRNIGLLGFSDRLDFHPGYSHEILPKLLADQRTYDFAFIDGSHLFDHIMLDFYYVDRLLAQGGYVLFHDAWMRSTQLTVSFIRRNRRDYRRIRCPILNFRLFQKTGVDDRNWHHFREFYTALGVFSQRFGLWNARHKS
jgi:predicted O-methyltransferase YrrM